MMEAQSKPAAPGGRDGSRRAKAAAACVAVLALAAGAYALHVQPGVEGNPERDLLDCGEAMGLVSTSLLRWNAAGGYGREYPESLDGLASEGLFPGGRVPECPLTGRYRYEGQLRPDMPLGTILVWESGPAHEFRKGDRVALHYVSATARVYAMVQDVGPGGETAARERLAARFESALERQRRAVDAVRRALAGDSGAWDGLETALAGGSDPLAAAFAAYAAGRAGRKDLCGALARALKAAGPEFGEPSFSLAAALWALGGREGAAVLAGGLSNADYFVRRRCFAMLEPAAGEDFGYAPYLPQAEMEAAALRWRAWAGKVSG